MLRTLTSLRALVLLGALGLASFAGSTANAQDYCGPVSHPDLFYNFYVAPVPCGPFGATGAQLYVSPLPVPEYVGHTYITYQPFLPHEYMYKHHRTYRRYHGPHSGTTVTKVRYR